MWRRAPKWCQRRLARWLGCRLCRIRLAKAIVSFTFDDFPRSALLRGGATLRDHGYAGTYYLSLGLMGLNTPTGEMFSRADLGVLVRDGHDLGCHTFDHCDSWETPSAQFEESMVRNQQALARELPGSALKSLSYPISYPRPKTKRLAARHYSCARGGGQTFNRGFADLNYLKAFFIEQSRDNLDAIRAAIDGNAREQGWLIFATHDVCDTPTRFGCTPRCFEEVVRYASASGAAVLPVQEACRRIRGQSPA